MKQYEPHKGRVESEESGIADTVAKTVAGSQQSGPAQTDTAAGAVFHFSRDGRRIRVSSDDRVEGRPATVTAAPLDGSGHPLPSASGLLAASGAVTELFATLSEDQKLSPQVADVVESMRCLAVKLEEKKRLEDELAAVTAQIVIVEQVLQRHVRVARDSEIKALAMRQARAELIGELADSILYEKCTGKTV
jgi:hypothetical protein